MKDITLVVTVALPPEAPDEDALCFIRAAIEEHAERHEDLAPPAIRIEAPDGTVVEI